MLPKAIRQFLFITGNISEQPLIKATIVLWPHPLQKTPGTPGVGLVIQQGDRMFMFQAWPRAVGGTKNDRHLPQSPRSKSESLAKFTATAVRLGLILAKQLGCRALARLILEIDIGERNRRGAVTEVTQAAMGVADSLTIKAVECGRWVVA
jgi:hypothetical protein